MHSPPTPKQNRLLAALPDDDYARLLPDLELISMPLGRVVYESGGQLGYLYFPTTSIVSLLYVTENGASAEIAITGNEGLVGISLFMGGESTPSRAKCHAMSVSAASISTPVSGQALASRCSPKMAPRRIC